MDPVGQALAALRDSRSELEPGSGCVCTADCPSRKPKRSGDIHLQVSQLMQEVSTHRGPGAFCCRLERSLLAKTCASVNSPAREAPLLLERDFDIQGLTGGTRRVVSVPASGHGRIASTPSAAVSRDLATLGRFGLRAAPPHQPYVRRLE